MADEPARGVTQKAAVLVVDNQFGFADIDARTMNNIGTDVFRDLLASHYDRVFVVVAPPRTPGNNPVVKTLRRASSKYATVDMFVAMHTNMEEGELAQIPFSAFERGFTEEQRAHLRFLYNMGCGDGNPVSALVVERLGFKTFVGHKGNGSVSPLFTYPALRRWLERQEPIAAVSRNVYKDLRSCPDQILRAAFEHPRDLGLVLQAAGACEDGGEGFTCVDRREHEALASVRDSVIRGVDQCLPEVLPFWARYRPVFEAKYQKATQGFTSGLGGTLFRMMAELSQRPCTEGPGGRSLMSAWVSIWCSN